MKVMPWLAGTLLYLIFLVTTAPAALLPWLSQYLASPGITASSTTGTLWQGEARNASFKPAGRQAIALEFFSWRIQPLGLLLGQLPIRLEFSSAGGMKGGASLNLTRAGVDMTQLHATLPAAWLSEFLPDIATHQLEGSFVLHSDQFSLRSKHYQGRGEIVWQQAALGLSQVRPLGSYRGEITGMGENIQFHLDTQNGPLELTGNGTWSHKKGMHFSGTARARERETELAAVLRLLGKPDQNGFYQLNF